MEYNRFKILSYLFFFFFFNDVKDTIFHKLFTSLLTSFFNDVKGTIFSKKNLRNRLHHCNIIISFLVSI